MNTELVERLRDYAGDDHERLCQGRNYDCTCGYDERRDPLIAAAADELTTLTAKVALLTEALRKARIWHESEDKSLSKQPPSYGPEGNQWARLQHQEQISEIEAALNPQG